MSSEKFELDQIICGDNRKVLEDFPDNFFDLVVTSPPYGEIRDYNGYSWDYKELAKVLYRKLKDGGRIVWIVGYEVKDFGASVDPFRQVCYFVDQAGFKLNQTIIYGKRGCRFPGGEDAKSYDRMHEYMFVFSKGVPKIANLLKDRHKTESTLHRGRTTILHSKRNKAGEIEQRRVKLDYENEFTMRSDIWFYKIGYSNMGEEKELIFQHPAIFQEKLAEDHILSWSNEGDIVLDPFAGSGTTCKMAKVNLRHYIGIEISDSYCHLARERVENTNTQIYRFENMKDLEKHTRKLRDL